MPSVRTCNLKNVLGPISPDSLPFFYSECSASGRHQRRSRETIRSSGLEFASSKPELESTTERPLLLAGRPQCPLNPFPPQAERALGYVAGTSVDRSP